jgi:hypothetical protein
MSQIFEPIQYLPPCRIIVKGVTPKLQTPFEPKMILSKQFVTCAGFGFAGESARVSLILGQQYRTSRYGSTCSKEAAFSDTLFVAGFR